MLIRPAREEDRDAWECMRQRLWPSKPGEHADEITRYFAGDLCEPVEVLLAFDEQGEPVGLIELSIRNYAEGCATDRVAFVEGWYVDPAERHKGVGAALIRAAESWATSQGCTDLASDTEFDNNASIAALLATGFTDAGTIRCFKKSL